MLQVGVHVHPQKLHLQLYRTSSETPHCFCTGELRGGEGNLLETNRVLRSLVEIQVKPSEDHDSGGVCRPYLDLLEANRQLEVKTSILTDRQPLLQAQLCLKLALLP